MKKFLASFVLFVALVAFVAPAFANCYLQSHNSFNATRKLDSGKIIHYKKCECHWLDDNFERQRYIGPDTNCPYCTGSIIFLRKGSK